MLLWFCHVACCPWPVQAAQSPPHRRSRSLKIRAGLPVKSGAGPRLSLLQIMHQIFTVVCASATGLGCLWLVLCMSQGSSPFPGCCAAAE